MHEFNTLPELETGVVATISARLQDAIARRGRAIMLAAGGRTPANIYTKLGQDAAIDWARTTVGLTDERWVEESHAASNTAMLKQTLLSGEARQATFLPMKIDEDDVFKAVPEVDRIYQPARCSDVMVLGMGPDAHTLSWFAGAQGYDDAVSAATVSTVACLIAPQSSVTGSNTTRMTLTRTCVAQARSVLLLITGKDKRQVFVDAENDTPVGIMRAAAGDALSVFYTD